MFSYSLFWMCWLSLFSFIHKIIKEQQVFLHCYSLIVTRVFRGYQTGSREDSNATVYKKDVFFCFNILPFSQTG